MNYKNIVFLNFKSIFDNTKAAAVAASTCKTVPTRLIKRLFVRYLEKGTLSPKSNSKRQIIIKRRTLYSEHCAGGKTSISSSGLNDVTLL